MKNLITILIIINFIKPEENYLYSYDFEIDLKISFYQMEENIVNFKIHTFRLILAQKFSKIIKKNLKSDSFEQKKIIWKKGLVNKKCDVQNNVRQLDLNNIIEHRSLFENILIRVFIKSKNVNVFGKEKVIKLKNLKKRFEKIDISWKSKDSINFGIHNMKVKENENNEIFINKHNKDNLIAFRDLECEIGNKKFYDQKTNRFYLDLYLAEDNYEIEKNFGLKEKYKGEEVYEFEEMEGLDF